MAHDLSNLGAGETARIAALSTPEPLRQRLLELGFTPGVQVSCLFCAPGGDPRAYLVRDTIVALRSADARTIRIAGGTPHQKT